MQIVYEKEAAKHIQEQDKPTRQRGDRNEQRNVKRYDCIGFVISDFAIAI